MPRRRRQQQGLERVLGTPALFSTAYGNVGSSIYYALGVTAAIALGLTPVVFLISGLIFAATAATYAEGTVRYPEAGGSSSFARHAFNELVSFVAAWAQMLNYIITVAISAFFVPHYLSIFWEPLKTNPWDIIGGAAVIIVLVALNIVGIKEAAKLNIFLAVDRLRHAGAAGDHRLRDRLPPARPDRERALGDRADLGQLRARDPGRDDRVHRDRDRLEPRRGGAGPDALDPCLDPPRRRRRLRDLLHAAARRALRAAGLQGRGRRVRDEARAAAGQGRVRERPGARPRREPRHPRLRPQRRQGLRRRPRRDDPLHRHQRGRDRRVAHHLLDGELPAAAGGLPPAAPALQDAVAVADRLRRGHLDRGAAPGQGRLPRDDVLVRRDAVVHDRAASP